MTLAAACMAAASAGAQDIKTYNDTVRTNTWTVTVGGGVSGTSKPRGAEDDTHLRVGPEVFVGVKYNITPMWRVALNAGYIHSRNFTGGIITSTKEEEGFMVGNDEYGYHPGTLITNGARLDNTWKAHQFYTELNLNWNILDLWHYRKAQKWNLWLGVGVGYMYSDWTDGQMWAYDANALAQGDTYFNVYGHSYLNAQDFGHYLNSVYVPMSLSLEYDITPRWTAGVYGQAKWFPQSQDAMPKWMWGAGVSLSYNFIGKRFTSDRKKLDEALARYEQLRQDCDARNEALAKALADQEQLNKKLRDDQGELNKKLEAKERITQHVVYFPLDKYYLTQQEKVRLDDFISKLKDVNDAKLTIVGEASTDGYVDHNQTLSENRLKTVLNYLKDNGVSEQSVKKTDAYGDTKAELHPRYRRVTISVE